MGFDNSVEGTLAASFSSSATGPGTSEQLLKSFTLQPGMLNRNNQRLRIKAWGNTASNNNGKTVALKFGSSIIVTSTTGANNTPWVLEADVARISSSSQVARAGGQTAQSFINEANATLSEDLSGPLVIAMSATDGSDSAGDISCNGFIVELCQEA